MAVASALSSAPAPPSAKEQMRLLFWLKLRMTMRGFQRSKLALVGTILSLLIFFPLAFGMGIGATLLLSNTPSQALAESFLQGILLIIYLIWLTSPLLGFQLNETYDITRLFVYPVSLRRLFVGSILGSILDTPTLMLLPTLFGTLIGFSLRGSFAPVISVLVVPLFLFHTLALSQATLLATAGVLRSRKWRDFAIVAVPLFWVAYQVFYRVFLPEHMGSSVLIRFFHSPVWRAVGFLPPGCAARAMSAASVGAILPALGYLCALGLYTIATVYLAAWLIGKAYDGDDVSVLNLKRAQKPTAVTASPNAEAIALPTARKTGPLSLPPVVAAITEKEFRYFARDPYFRVALVNTIYMLVIFAVSMFNASSPSRRHHYESPGAVGGPWAGVAVWIGTCLLLLQQASLTYNQFGTDGAAAPILMGFPASRRQMLIGKNIPLFMVLLAENLVIGIILSFLYHAVDVMPIVLLWLTLATGILFAVGNVISVTFPYKIVVKGFRTQRMAGMGGATGFIYLGITLAASTIFLPVAAGIVIPWYEFFGVGRGWLALTLPVALAYVVGLYLLSLHYAEHLMLKNEPEIIEKVYRAPV